MEKSIKNKSANQTLACPHCGGELDLGEAVAARLRAGLESQLREELGAEFTRREQAQQGQNELAQAELKRALAAKSEELAGLLRLKNEMEILRRERAEGEARAALAARQEAAVEFAKAEQERVEFAKAQIRAELAAAAVAKDAAARQELERRELELRELRLKFEGLNAQLAQAKSRAEQGSQQGQGEAAELVVEEYLRQAFRNDEITEVVKGVVGADCLQLVRDGAGRVCGRILYEVKRTKDFNKNWLDKLRADSVAAKADVAVLITQALPNFSQGRTEYFEGILIVPFFEFKPVVAVLREGVINAFKLKNSLINKEAKNTALYDYLASQEFRTQLALILKTYQDMSADLAAEQRAMRKIWKKRERTIERLSLNSSQIVASLDAIFSEGGGQLIGREGLALLEDLGEEDEVDEAGEDFEDKE